MSWASTTSSTLKAIEAAALLHDTGKLAVPEHILNKPGKLTAAEFDQMKLHVDVGADILSLVEFPYPVVPIVRGHHESWDGSGYPRGVIGEAIPIGARILSVVDCFDALTSDRPYRRRMTDAAAIEILMERRGHMYDPAVVDTFIRVYRGIASEKAPIWQHREVMQRITSRGYETTPAANRSRTSPERRQRTCWHSSAWRASRQAKEGERRAGARLEPARRRHPRRHRRVVSAGRRAQPYRGRGQFGPAAQVLRGASVALGERLTGWVAANRQPIINSDAALDLDARVNAITPPLSRCISVPLMAGEALVAVLTLYTAAPDGFTADHGRLIQIVAPHLARAIDAAVRTESASRGIGPQEKPGPRELRLVASR